MTMSRGLVASGGPMRRVGATLALALSLLGCSMVSPSPDPAGAMAHMTYDLSADPCSADQWVTGVIVRGPSGQAAIQDDQGVVRVLVWGTHNTAAVDWGHRYRIGGRWFDSDAMLWACAGASAVIPQ
jgi:hypothetical protein